MTDVSFCLLISPPPCHVWFNGWQKLFLFLFADINRKKSITCVHLVTIPERYLAWFTNFAHARFILSSWLLVLTAFTLRGELPLFSEWIPLNVGFDSHLSQWPILLRIILCAWMSVCLLSRTVQTSKCSFPKLLLTWSCQNSSHRKSFSLPYCALGRPGFNCGHTMMWVNYSLHGVVVVDLYS